MPNLVVGLTAAAFSCGWGMLLFVAAVTSFGEAGVYAALLVAVCGALGSLLVLQLCASLLLHIVDAVYLCYAVDKEQHTTTHANIHDVFKAFTHQGQGPKGGIVEHPDGGFMFGAGHDVAAVQTQMVVVSTQRAAPCTAAETAADDDAEHVVEMKPLLSKGL